MKVRRRLAAAVVGVLALMLVGCGPGLPDSVVPGSQITVGWTGTYTSANAAASPTPGNTDVAAAVRGRFGDIVDGDFVADDGFGTVKIVSDKPFVVRYDLAEPQWSDGITLDAADLLLGWAAASGGLNKTAPSDDDGTVPALDEFARSIEVSFAHPVRNWQTFVSVPVPAHIVGRLALGIDDAMQAKQAVITAIQTRDASALAKIAKVWKEGFTIADPQAIPADLLVSSGPYLVSKVEQVGKGQKVTLTPNPKYTGLKTPNVAEITLVPAGSDVVTALGKTVDVAAVAPVAKNWAPVHDLERVDFVVDTPDDGTEWVVLLNPAGLFEPRAAREAFLRSLPEQAMIDQGAGEWSSAFAGTQSVLTSPDSGAYDIVIEDSGFESTLGTKPDDEALARSAAGVAAGTPVCVLYDRTSEFARGAYAALQDTAKETGWGITDCGSDDYAAALAERKWNAVIARIKTPQTPGDIAAQWGSKGSANITGDSDKTRDKLITQLAQTADVYRARDVLGQIEGTIVTAAVVRPLAVNPRIFVIDRDVSGISPRGGPVAPLTSTVVDWAAVPKT